MSAPDAAPFLCCRVGDERFALAIADVVEVAAVVTPVPVPEAPSAWAGMVNRRGTLFPLLELRAIAGLPVQAWSANTLFVVVQADERRAGLVVDEVSPVQYVAAAAWQPLQGGRSWVRAMTYDHAGILQWLDVGALLQAYVGKA